ncbi:hypothetical protein TcasGA2_TC031581 [Tribolium castaneum]|uniref:Uncharacterized protein n=1 Tax=Tribolium castaneum TaxID=7070 RepID=A0A139WPC7_TRICA|nr:hypothetical protein TcasGA2_TC031581 [Tribolium castaneum]
MRRVTLYRQEDKNSKESQPRRSPPERPPSPIVIHGKAKDHGTLLQFCKRQAGKNFTIKYTRERTIISTKTRKKFNAIKDKMEQDELEYHTYTSREDKTHAFVLHGLDKGPEIGDLKAEMKEKGVDLINIYEMKNTQRPLFLVIMGKYETLNSISKKCPALSHIRVSFHRYIKKTRITQCHRCQEWGHATSNCRVKPKCLKCSGGYWTRECGISDDATPKCATPQTISIAPFTESGHGPKNQRMDEGPHDAIAAHAPHGCIPLASAEPAPSLPTTGAPESTTAPGAPPTPRDDNNGRDPRTALAGVQKAESSDAIVKGHKVQQQDLNSQDSVPGGSRIAGSYRAKRQGLNTNTNETPAE